MENIEIICEAVHQAYCAERIRQGKEPYWTKGDYNKLDEATKDYDRATVRAVKKFMGKLIEQQAERIEALETVIHRCIKAMSGSNCLELQWLEKALEGK